MAFCGLGVGLSDGLGGAWALGLDAARVRPYATRKTGFGRWFWAMGFGGGDFGGLGAEPSF